MKAARAGLPEDNLNQDMDPEACDSMLADESAGLSPEDRPSWPDIAEDPFLMLLHLKMLEGQSGTHKSEVSCFDSTRALDLAY